MNEEKIKENPTKKLQKIVMKRKTPLVLIGKNEYEHLSRKTSKGSFSADGGYSTFQDE